MDKALYIKCQCDYVNSVCYISELEEDDFKKIDVDCEVCETHFEVKIPYNTVDEIKDINNKFIYEIEEGFIIEIEKGHKGCGVFYIPDPPNAPIGIVITKKDYSCEKAFRTACETVLMFVAVVGVILLYCIIRTDGIDAPDYDGDY
jgi:hypothetical protein